jgi:signal peptidase complex subunit 1
MDFKGQKLSERGSQVALAAFAVVAFLLGYGLQSFRVMMTIFGSGVVITFVATVLDWPMYNRNPVVWRIPKQQPGGGRGSSAGGARPPPRKRAQASNFWNLFR